MASSTRPSGSERGSERSASAPTFSVVIAAFQAERTIGATVRSLLAQHDGDFEALVVDDGSTDATATEVEAFDDERVRLLR